MAVFQLWDAPALVLSKDQRSGFTTIKEGLAKHGGIDFAGTQSRCEVAAQ